MIYFHDSKWNICSNLDKRKTSVIGLASWLWKNLSRKENQSVLLGGKWHANNENIPFIFLGKYSVFMFSVISHSKEVVEILSKQHIWLILVFDQSCAILSYQWPYMLQHQNLETKCGEMTVQVLLFSHIHMSERIVSSPEVKTTSSFIYWLLELILCSYEKSSCFC